MQPRIGSLPILKPYHSAAGTIICVGLLAAPVFSQVSPPVSPPGNPYLEDSAETPALRLQQQIMQGSFGQEVTALEGPLDAEAYILGPGDVFSVAVGGLAPVRQSVPVSATGLLTLPEAEAIKAGGRTLASVQQEAVAALQRIYVHVPVSVSLVQTRKFYVHIAGAVPEPGRYLMPPISRVDNAVGYAYRAQIAICPDPAICPATSASSELPQLQEGFRPALRNIRVTSRDSTRRTVDLMRYYTMGDMDANPPLRDGDYIMVPSYHETRDAVRVSGEVPFAGSYDVRPNDYLMDLLEIVTAESGLEELHEVRITRANEARETLSVMVPDLLQDQSRGPMIQKGDLINVLPRIIDQAAIYGRVTYPGTYRISGGKTTLTDLLELAGGLKDDASSRSAFLERNNSLNFREFGRSSNLDFFSREYALSFPAHVANRLIIDIDAILRKEAEDVVLHDGDRIVFPRDESTVVVTGSVRRPGLVTFSVGQDARHYISLAGGLAPNARSIYVFQDGTGDFRTGASAAVRSGDTIFVDRKDNAESAQSAQLLLTKQQQRIQLTQVIITGVTAITGIITAYAAITR